MLLIVTLKKIQKIQQNINLLNHREYGVKFVKK